MMSGRTLKTKDMVDQETEPKGIYLSEDMLEAGDDGN